MGCLLHCPTSQVLSRIANECMKLVELTATHCMWQINKYWAEEHASLARRYAAENGSTRASRRLWEQAQVAAYGKDITSAITQQIANHRRSDTTYYRRQKLGRVIHILNVATNTNALYRQERFCSKVIPPKLSAADVT